MSPLGGQSASRLLSFRNTTTTTYNAFYFYHPDYQVSHYQMSASASVKGSVAALYSASMLSPMQQKQSPKDLWDLPKIPQWSKKANLGEWYEVDHESLKSGHNHYASLLGIRLQGFDSAQAETEYNLTIQTSYVDFDCTYAGIADEPKTPRPVDEVIEQSRLYVRDEYPFDVFVKTPESWGQWMTLEGPPPVQIGYFSQGYESEPVIDPGSGRLPDTSLFRTNCAMETILVETVIHCGTPASTISCSAQKQRRLRGQAHPNHLPMPLMKIAGGLQRAMLFWPLASGQVDSSIASPTENYILEESHPFSGQAPHIWPEVDRSIFPDLFSRRFTAAFNTYWDATLNPLAHTNVSFDAIPKPNILVQGQPSTQLFVNSTVGTKTTTQKVYRTNRLWVGILLTTTMFLQIFAILGLVLQMFVRGPDVLGFASSMTRDNPYVPLAPCGSYLDGPERARMLGNLRLQLADVRPEADTGYVAVRAVSSVARDGSGETDEPEKAAWRPLGPNRHYT